MKTIKLITYILPALLLIACGKATMEPSNSGFESKIVIEGFLAAGNPIKDIRITRNVPVGTDLNNTNLISDPNTTQVLLTNETDNITYDLAFHSTNNGSLDDYYWYCTDNSVLVENDKTYSIQVSAVIDGKTLNASSTTTVPSATFKIADINYTELQYRQKDENNEVLEFMVTFDHAVGSDFYMMVVNAMDAELDSFIYDNPIEKLDEQDVIDHYNDYIDEYNYIINIDDTPGQTDFRVWWSDLWFYGRHQINLMVVDENYGKFIDTYEDVQEDDGNFHEPIFAIEGDGIGVFGSFVADTTWITVTR